MIVYLIFVSKSYEKIKNNCKFKLYIYFDDAVN